MLISVINYMCKVFTFFGDVSIVSHQNFPSSPILGAEICAKKSPEASFLNLWAIAWDSRRAHKSVAQRLQKTRLRIEVRGKFFKSLGYSLGQSWSS